jgi:hypothetical protein
MTSRHVETLAPLRVLFNLQRLRVQAMLQIQQTLTGYPAADVQYLRLPNESLVVSRPMEASIVSYFLLSALPVWRCDHNPQCANTGTCARSCLLGSISKSCE